MVTGSGRGIDREQGGNELIHVDVDFENEKVHVEVQGSLSVVIADICTVLREVCEDGDIDPEWLIEALKATFLDGMKREKAKEDGLGFVAEVDGDTMERVLRAAHEAIKEAKKDEVKDERSKEALPGTNRRYRRVRPH